MHILLIDNRDSFTWNLAQALLALEVEVTVRRAESLELDDAGSLDLYTHVVVSPGPGAPERTEVSRRSLELCRGERPWLGVCLGHQVLAEALGARVGPTGAPVHGKQDWIHHDGSGIFRRLPDPFRAARYHSLAVDRDTLPETVRIVAWSGDDQVMGIGVPGEPTWGVQFHPESFMSPEGPALLAEFLSGVECPASPEGRPKRGRR